MSPMSGASGIVVRKAHTGDTVRQRTCMHGTIERTSPRWLQGLRRVSRVITLPISVALHTTGCYKGCACASKPTEVVDAKRTDSANRQKGLRWFSWSTMLTGRRSSRASRCSRAASLDTLLLGDQHGAIRMPCKRLQNVPMTVWCCMERLQFQQDCSVVLLRRLASS